MSNTAETRLRFIVCGNVDDGKSTLIGRLLVDTDSLFIDQLEDLKKTSQVRQNSEDQTLLNFALVTDGLKSEREQGITIDVAYRFFSTEKRSFCIIDVPGHAQYLRNMFTGATNADLGILLIDSKIGISEQTRRHLLILSLVGLKQIIVAVNKMDAVEFSEKHFNQIKNQLETLAAAMGIQNLIYLPLSSLRGDNLISLSTNTPWYKGLPLLTMLENFKVPSKEISGAAAAIQGVIRVGDDRFYMLDQINGEFKSGDEVMLYPQELNITLKEVTKYHTQVTQDYDIERGSFLMKKPKADFYRDQLVANICWFAPVPLKKAPYLFSFCGNSIRCQVVSVLGEYDLNQGGLVTKSSELKLNDLVQVEIKLSKPLYLSDFQTSSKLGSFLMIDPLTNQTVAAGTIQ